MDLLDTKQKSASGSVVASTANTRLTGSWLLIARTVWLALIIPSLGLFVVGLPLYLTRELILRDQLIVRVILGFAASVAAPSLSLLFLLTTGQEPLFGWGTLWQLLVMGFGGAVATHVRVGNPLATHILFPIYVAALLWGGLWLRNQRLRELLPLRSARV